MPRGGVLARFYRPGGGVLARFYRPGGGGFELFLPGGGGIRPSKNCPGVGGDGQAWN